MSRSLTDEKIVGFGEFVDQVESRLRVALVATYGAQNGRAATVNALSWAWEHWDEVQSMTNPVGYLYRVGQSATRGLMVRPIPFERYEPTVDELLGISPELVGVRSRACRCSNARQSCSSTPSAEPSAT